MQAVFITGMGIASPIGQNCRLFWEALVQGASGLGPLTRFPTDWLATHVGAELKPFPTPPLAGDGLKPAESLLLRTCQEALHQAGLLSPQGKTTQPELEILIGSNMTDFFNALESGIQERIRDQTLDLTRAFARTRLSENAFHNLLTNVAARLAATGLQRMISNACSTGAYAIALGAERIRQGKTQRALCGGVDVLSQMVYAGFSSLRSLAPKVCQPFDKNRQGLVLGEGAAALVLESADSCQARGAVPLARLLGWGWSSDAHHLSAPHPAGRGTILALQRALKHARLLPENVDCLVAHGTGTPSNDSAEAQAMVSVFGPRVPPVTAPKSMLGHSIGAASAIEALVAVRITQTGTIPPTINFTTPDPACPIDCVPNRSRGLPVAVCQTNASGFGGNNVSLIFAQPQWQEASHA